MKVESLEILSMAPFPNNELPLLLYKNAAGKAQPDPEWFEETFRTNGWTGSWRNGVYSFHHFHAEAHEVLGCYSGNASVLFGGPDGTEARLEAGDALIVPAGVGHCLIKASASFHVVGAYPKGTYPDLRRGSAKEYEILQRTVKAVPRPLRDPISGMTGALQELWFGA